MVYLKKKKFNLLFISKHYLCHKLQKLVEASFNAKSPKIFHKYDKVNNFAITWNTGGKSPKIPVILFITHYN